jgi:hypothetical protein
VITHSDYSVSTTGAVRRVRIAKQAATQSSAHVLSQRQLLEYKGYDTYTADARFVLRCASFNDPSVYKCEVWISVQRVAGRKDVSRVEVWRKCGAIELGHELMQHLVKRNGSRRLTSNCCRSDHIMPFVHYSYTHIIQLVSCYCDFSLPSSSSYVMFISPDAAISSAKFLGMSSSDLYMLS